MGNSFFGRAPALRASPGRLWPVELEPLGSSWFTSAHLLSLLPLVIVLMPRAYGCHSRASGFRWPSHASPLFLGMSTHSRPLNVLRPDSNWDRFLVDVHESSSDLCRGRVSSAA